MALVLSVQSHAQITATERAESTVAQMTNAEKIQLVLGHLTSPMGEYEPPSEAIVGAGFVPGVSRLGVPPLWETDASLGITWIGGNRGTGGTALPSGTAQGSTWNSDLIEQGGRMLGTEASAKGFNVLLAGGMNLMRDPRNGRTFEYLGEDPWHAALIASAAVRGIQSRNVISTLKHFAINPQETGRHFMNVEIDEAALRESDLLAFELAIEQSGPGALMCAYNALNGPLSCGNPFLLTDILRDDWGYQGFVMSDWGAVEATDFAMAGLDQQSGAQIDEDLFFGDALLELAQTDSDYEARLTQMAQNVLYAIYDVGLDTNLPTREDFDKAAHAELSKQIAEEGIVLLKNEGDVLPIFGAPRQILVIGGNADAGTPSGGGSSRVAADEGPAITVPFIRGSDAPFASMLDQMYHNSAPVDALREALPSTEIIYRDGRYPSEAAMLAEDADLVIVFATQYQTEGYDVADLSLPNGQDVLIAAVAEANENTIIVLETGGPVAMPWLNDVSAVLEAWYPGAKGGEAIANVLTGKVNPSGHLPISFPKSLDDLPRSELAGLKEVAPSFIGKGAPGQTLTENYDIEGSDIGYRWYAREGIKTLFPFGAGLSYTEFNFGGLSMTGSTAELKARFEVENTGDADGADVAQLYLTSINDKPVQRLVGFQKVRLAPGEATDVSLTIEPRLLANWTDDHWVIDEGTYTFALGYDAETLLEPDYVTLERLELASDGTTIITSESHE